MARPSKDSIPVNIKMDKNLAIALNDYSKDSGVPKTIVIEKAVQEYLEKRNGNKK